MAGESTAALLQRARVMIEDAHAVFPSADEGQQSSLPHSSFALPPLAPRAVSPVKHSAPHTPHVGDVPCDRGSQQPPSMERTWPSFTVPAVPRAAEQLRSADQAARLSAVLLLHQRDFASQADLACGAVARRVAGTFTDAVATRSCATGTDAPTVSDKAVECNQRVLTVTRSTSPEPTPARSQCTQASPLTATAATATDPLPPAVPLSVLEEERRQHRLELQALQQRLADHQALSLAAAETATQRYEALERAFDALRATTAAVLQPSRTDATRAFGEADAAIGLAVSPRPQPPPPTAVSFSSTWAARGASESPWLADRAARSESSSRSRSRGLASDTAADAADLEALLSQCEVVLSAARATRNRR
jgi:hypothetical protein